MIEQQAIVILTGVMLIHLIVGLWVTSIYNHRVLTHRSMQMTSPVFERLHWFLAVYSMAGMDPKEGWAISHWWHHILTEMRRLDPYSLKEYPFLKVLFNSAGCLSEHNSRPGMRETVPSLHSTEWEHRVRRLGKVWIWWTQITLYVILPAGYMWSVSGFDAAFGTALLAPLFGFGAIFLQLIGGGTVNSICHTTKGKISIWLGFPVEQAEDGSLAQNRALVGYAIGEGWHRNHHGRPGEANFGWRKPWQIDWMFWTVRLIWQPLGLMKIEGGSQIVDVEAIRRFIQTQEELTEAEVTLGLQQLESFLEKTSEAVVVTV